MKKEYSLKNIDVTYNGSGVLHNISFSINKGDFVSIIGANGAGKSTLLKVMTRLVEPQRGEILFFGNPMSDCSRRFIAKKVGYLPQVSQIIFPYSCFDMVMIGRTPHLNGLMLGSKNDRKIVEKIMFETDCLQFAERDINSISVGERQRVFIARALASEPDLLLLDEPGSSLDLHHSVEIYRLLEKLNFECGITVIVVSHNLNITAQFAKRVIFLHKGEIIADDTPSGALIHKNLSMAYGDSFDLLEGEKSKRPVIIPRRL